LVGAFNEGFDKGVRDVTKNRAYHALEHFAFKFVGEPKLDLARMLTKRCKPPVAIEFSKRPISKNQMHVMRRILGVGRGEMRADAVIIDIEPRDREGRRALDRLGTSAPRQKLRVVFYSVHQLEHLTCSAFDENQLFHFRHVRRPGSRKGTGKIAILLDRLA
jgi:hypothetical protein